MKLISDLHIHSKYSRGCSTDLDITSLEKYARMKGVGLLGTGDFTHPRWISEIRSKLSDDGYGILRSKTGFPFVLQTELSLIYTQAGKGRKVHNVVLAPDLETVSQITDELLRRGRVDYDGRPIFKIPCPEFMEMLRDIDDKIEVIPAHIWTPWFSMFGSKSGFDKVKDCFLDQEKHVHAIETGLSSDPPMNWRIKELDNRQILSFSDLHSYWPWRIGREATVFDIDIEKDGYANLLKAIRTGQGLSETIEVDPNYGKYHVDGHRKCNVRLTPSEAKKLDGICPVCKKPLTLGVLGRVEDLADPARPEGYKPKGAKPFRSMIPLSEILSLMLGKGVATKGVWDEYNKIMAVGKSEYDVLLNTTEEKLLSATKPAIAKAIIANRTGQIKIKPGYDGVYGEPVLDGYGAAIKKIKAD